MSASADAAFQWPDGRSCAVALTYDDALPIHYGYVAPALEARGIRGTFYVLISGDPMDHWQDWRRIAASGHELGNHTLFHPCRREPTEDFPWLDPGFDLRVYTPYRFVLEARVANFVLQLIDGRTTRTYGNTCSERFLGDGRSRQCIDDLLRPEFVAARGAMTNRAAVVSQELDLMNVGHCVGDLRTFPELRDEICAARDARGWLVYVVHGVGEQTKELYIEQETHEQLLDWLASEPDIWVQPFLTQATWVREWQAARKG